MPHALPNWPTNVLQRCWTLVRPQVRSFGFVGVTISWLFSIGAFVAGLAKGISPFVFGSYAILKSPMDLLSAKLDAQRAAVQMDIADLQYMLALTQAETGRANRQADHILGRTALVQQHRDRAEETVRALAHVGERTDRLIHQFGVLKAYSQSKSSRTSNRGAEVQSAFASRESLMAAMNNTPRSRFTDYYKKVGRNQAMS